MKGLKDSLKATLMKFKKSTKIKTGLKKSLTKGYK